MTKPTKILGRRYPLPYLFPLFERREAMTGLYMVLLRVTLFIRSGYIEKGAALE